MREGHKYANEEALWRQTIADNPDAWMAYNNLGGVFLRDYGRLGDAAELVRQGDPRRALAVLRTSSTEELESLATRLGRVTSDQDARVADAMERMRRPLMERAIEQFRASLELNPANDQAVGNLAVAMHRLGRYEEALAYWRELIARRTAAPDDLYGMGLTLEQLGRTDQAVATYERILGEAPEHLAAHLRLGEILAQEGRHEEAKAHFEFLVARYPGSIKLQLYLGGRAESDGEWAKAVDHYRTALKYVQDTTDALELTKRLAAVYAELGRFDEAVRTAEQALTLAREKAMPQLIADLESRLQAYRAGRVGPG